jgi:hypothetical protein
MPQAKKSSKNQPDPAASQAIQDQSSKMHGISPTQHGIVAEYATVHGAKEAGYLL